MNRLSKITDVVGYTADAETYCISCTYELYGDDKLGTIEILDHESNPTHPIFAGDEFDYPVSCGKCHEFIDTNLTSDGIDYAYEMIKESLKTKRVTLYMLEVADSLLWMTLGKNQREDEKRKKCVLDYIEIAAQLKDSPGRH